ncbi:MAG: radical SAM family heme chaperone HemW [Thermodesulfovibrionales bacterium]|nr:radical SAM family heme chaperone HemW [Thermodesulfovibrionales bacterium]
MACSLYIHIPFCLRKCAYCDFLSVPFDKGISVRYVKALIKEIVLRAEDLNASGGPSPLRTIYIGGGTPTLLSNESLKEIFKTIRECFGFSAGAEITIEANPGTLDGSKMEAIVLAGVNRLSLGVQSLDDAELAALGRIHTGDDASRAAALVKESGIENLSLDLIYGIPGQRLKGWRNTLKRALGLKPRHISAYELTPEPGTPLYESLRTGSLRLPGEDEVSDMFYLAVDELESAGLLHYEISNYAYPGYECRHNLNYWRRGEYIGAGAGAHSFIGERRIKNTEDVFNYIELLSSGSLPFDELEEVRKEEAVKEFIFLGLRTGEGIDTRLLKGNASGLINASRALIEGGFMELRGDCLRLTKRGTALYSSVIVELFRAIGLD